MKFLIAGLGSVGRRHLRNLVALGQRDIVLLRSGKSTMPVDALGDFPVVTDLRRGIDHRPDAVIVSNPTALHLDVAIPAAEAGCHLLIEKPISDSLERVEALRAAVAQGKSRVLVGFQFRFHPTLHQAKSLLEGGGFGRVVSARAHWGEYLPDWHPWEDHRVSYAARRDLGGGVLLTLCHPFDYLGWLFGDVVQASGVLGEGLGLEVEAVAEAVLRFRSGVLAGVHLDYLQRSPDHHLDIVAEGGQLHWEGQTGDLSVRRTSDPTWVHHPAPPGFERNDLFAAEMRHFIDVVAGDAPPLCSLEDGIKVQQIVDSIRASSSGGSRLDLS